MILTTFKSYLPDKKWLSEHNDKRDEFILGLEGSTPPAISYEEKMGGSSRTEGQKKAIVGDEIDAYDKKYKNRVMKCKLTILLCQEWLDAVELKDRKIVELSFMTEKTTQQEVSSQIGYERSWVKRRIDAAISYLEQVN